MELKFYLVPFLKKLMLRCFCSYWHFISFKDKFCFSFLIVAVLNFLLGGVQGRAFPFWRTVLRCFLMCRHLYCVAEAMFQWWRRIGKHRSGTSCRAIAPIKNLQTTVPACMTSVPYISLILPKIIMQRKKKRKNYQSIRKILHC